MIPVSYRPIFVGTLYCRNRDSCVPGNLASCVRVQYVRKRVHRPTRTKLAKLTSAARNPPRTVWLTAATLGIKLIRYFTCQPCATRPNSRYSRGRRCTVPCHARTDRCLHDSRSGAIFVFLVSHTRPTSLSFPVLSPPITEL